MRKKSLGEGAASTKKNGKNGTGWVVDVQEECLNAREAEKVTPREPPLTLKDAEPRGQKSYIFP